MSLALTETRANASVRSAAYALVARALEFPDERWLAACGEAAVAMRGARDTSPHAGELHSTLDPLLAEFHAALAFTGAEASTALDALRDRHAALFGHAVRGKCPPYELEYGAGEIVQRASDLADIGGFYRAFGLQLADGAAERADHAVVECEFMSVLCAKEAYGLQIGDQLMVEAVRDARRMFLRDHVSQWMLAFARRLAQSHPEGLYGRLGAFLEEMLADECAVLGVPAGPAWLDLRPIDEVAETSFECGVEESAPGARDRVVQVTVGGRPSGSA